MSFDSYEDSVVDSVHNPTGHYTETDEFGNDTGSGYSSPDSGGLYQNHTPSPSWNPAWATGVNPEYQNEQFIQDRAADGWSREHLNSMGASIFQDRAAKTPTLAPHEQSIQNQIQVNPIDFNQMPQSTRNNIAGILNQDYTGAQGEQYAHKGVSPNGFHFAIDELLGVEGTLPPDASKDNAFKKAVDSGASTVVDFAGGLIKDGWDWMTEDQVNKADPVEESVGNTLPTTPVSEALDDINKARYSAFKRAGSLGNTGPVGPDGTSFSPGRWDSYEKADQVQSSMNDGLMNTLTQAYNSKPNMANARQVAHSGLIATDALTYEDRQAMSDKQIVELINRIGNESTINAERYEEYDRDPLVPSSYRPIYSDKDAALINRFRWEGKTSDTPTPRYTGGSNKMGFPDPYTGQVQAPTIEHRESLGIEPMTLSPEQQNNLVNVVMSVTPAGRVAMFGKAAVEYAMKVAQKMNPAGTKIMPSMAKSDLYTLQELGMMKPKSNTTYLGGKGKTLTGEGRINRNINRDIMK